MPVLDQLIHLHKKLRYIHLANIFYRRYMYDIDQSDSVEMAAAVARFVFNLCEAVFANNVNNVEVLE